jgi:uncharacterized membrane protein required for colicin V production
MQPLDQLIAIVLGLGALWGAILGLRHAVAGPLALLLAITGASSIYPRLAQLFIDVGGRGIETQAFTLLLCCLIGIFIFGLLNRSLAAAVKAGDLAGVVNHLLGATGGLALAAFVCGAFISLARDFRGEAVKAALAASQLAPLTLRFFEALSSWLERKAW